MRLLIVPDKGRSFSSVRPEAEIYLSLARAGHELTVCVDPQSAYLSRYEAANIDLQDLPYGSKLVWKHIKKLNHLIRSKNIEAVYATTSRTIPNAAMACIGTSAKMVAYRGTTGGLYRTDISNYLGVFNPRINGIVCVSNAVEDHVKARVRKSIRPFVSTIHKGHDTSWYMESAADLKEFASDSTKFTVMCIGSHRPYKGMQYFLEALHHVQDLPELRVVLVGNGFDKPEFQKQIQATGMADRINQPGFRQDVPQIAKACDIMVAPSLREGLPRAVMESLANGTPVITAANPGTMEIIEDNQNGFIVPLADPEAIAEKIRFLYNAPDELQRLTDHATDVINGRLSHQSTVDTFTEYFSQIIAQ